MKYLIDRASLHIQSLLWYVGIAIHNPIRDECSPDFNCCANCGRKAFIKIPDKKIIHSL